MSVLKKIKIWIEASRALYTITVLLPCAVGGVVAWQEGFAFDWTLMILILLGAMFANIGTNFTNDYFDYKSGVDKIDEGRVYKKGSEVLYDNPEANDASADGSSLNFFSPATILVSALASFAITFAIGMYFVFYVNWLILPIGVAGILLGYFYTAPPFKFGYRGLGDLICFLGNGPLPVIGTYLLFTGTASATVVLASVVVGLLVTAIVYIGNVPDAEADAKVGKKTVSVRLGRKAVKKLAPAYYIAIYALIILGAALGLFPVWTILSLLALPIVIQIIKITREHYDDIPKFAPSILKTVKTFALSTILFATGFIIDKLIN